MVKKGIVIILAIGSIFYFAENKLSAQRPDIYNTPPNVPQLEPIVKGDRVLIMAPHPDDEALGTAGIIQQAIRAGADVRILYLTNGEHNQLAFIVYEKRFVIKQKALVEMGEIRQKEAISAMRLLGVPEENLIFLGYPDFGTLAIFLRYWADSKPFKNMLTWISNVPYKSALTPNAPYKGEAILWDIESVLRKYKPTIVFVTNSVDTNRDHRACYLFLQVALWDLKGQIPEPKIYPYIIHCYAWPNPRNYHPSMYVPIPKLLGHSQIEWVSHDLLPQEVEKKHEAIRLYKSQCADSAFYLTAFARKNELFGVYPVIELSKFKNKDAFEKAITFRDKTVTYSRISDDLVINIYSRREAGTNYRFYVNLVGYNPNIEFPKMPKLKINVDGDNIKILDSGKFIKVEGLELYQKKHSVTIKIPLNVLKDPQYLLSSVNTYTANFPSDFNAWRVIKVK